MTTGNSIFQFATVRNADNKEIKHTVHDILPQTEVMDSLVSILNSTKKPTEKLDAFNKSLTEFTTSNLFYKTNAEIKGDLQKFESVFQNKNASPELTKFYNNLYDNIVIRILTKSNTSEVYRLLVDGLKSFHQKINKDRLKPEDTSPLQILLPEELILPFARPEPSNNTNTSVTTDNINELIKQQDTLLKEKKDKLALLTKKNESIFTEQQRIARLERELGNYQIPDTTTKSSSSIKTAKAAKPSSERTEVPRTELNKLFAEEKTLQGRLVDIDAELTQLNAEIMPRTIHHQRYAIIGDSYQDVTKLPMFEDPWLTPYEPAPGHTSSVQGNNLVVYHNGCHLKFPFKVADLRVIEQKTVAYLPTEIAHINNTQPGEQQERITRRLKKVETFDFFSSEDELTKETDTQSTEKFTLEKAAQDIQTEEMGINVNVGASAKFGPVSTSLDAGFNYSTSSVNSNSSAQSYAKEMVQRVVDKVSKKTKIERSVKTIEEFEETVKHLVDNSGANNHGPKSYVYRWLNKMVSATLKNYGKRLIFQIDVAHPSHFVITNDVATKPVIEIPDDPRTLTTFTVDQINETNYLAWAKIYQAKLDAPPITKKFYGFTASKTIENIVTIEEGYYVDKVHITDVFYQASNGYGALQIIVGRNMQNSHLLPGGPSSVVMYPTYSAHSETNQFPIAVWCPYGSFSATIEVECTITNRKLGEWKSRCYHALIEAYDTLKMDAEAKMSAFNPNNPGISPGNKTELIRNELKKGALQKMFRCNPFWITDNYEVGKEYQANCCAEMSKAEHIRFLEHTFDWKNMTYELHPYLYADKDNWKGLTNLTDKDPHFEKFLQASYATLYIPVHRDAEKEIAAVNFILYNSIANQSAVPAPMLPVLADLNSNTPFGFIDETNSTIPFVSIKKEYDRTGQARVFYLDNAGNEVLCYEVTEFDKEGNQTLFYYNAATNQVVISEIKQGVNSAGQTYNYYFNSANEKIITHRTKTDYDIEGNSTPYYAVDLGIFNIPTDLVILEAIAQNGIEVRGYPENTADPSSDVIIPKYYSPAIISR